MAFVICATRVETIMKTFWPQERAIWIADETRAKIQMRLSLRLYQGQPLLPDDPRTHLEHVLDTIYRKRGTKYISTVQRVLA